MSISLPSVFLSIEFIFLGWGKLACFAWPCLENRGIALQYMDYAYYFRVFPENYLFQVPHNMISATALLQLEYPGVDLEWIKKWIIWGKYMIYSPINRLLYFILVLTLEVAIFDLCDYLGTAQRAFRALPWIWIEITVLKLYFLIK